MKLLAVLVGLLCISFVVADIYMQNPRGGNNRNREGNTNRDNANRLFDSQNNAKGGYCRGPQMSFYEHSQLSIEWTAQHGCGNPKLKCQFIIQYMCTANDATTAARVRDGTTTNTITDDDNGPTALDGTELLYGMHESRANYVACKTRRRNMGLYIADRESEGGLSAGRSTAIFTRQENDGTRYGYECNEERDYYPYWHPSEWKDIAVLTDDQSECAFYQDNSQNKKERYQCINSATKAPVAPNTEAGCKAQATNEWVKVAGWGLSAPLCLKNEYERENHLGNSNSGAVTAQFNWTIPTASDESCIKDNKCACVLRMRYNISAHDVGDKGNNIDTGFIDWKSNADASPIKQDEIVYVDGLPHQLALNTNQYGRTFQDRSHTFQIAPRPKSVPDLAKIYNLNVRGKRGNIVQTYPATEYDFVPRHLDIYNKDYIHFQWTGCDQNPAGNAGEGTDRTDRSNIVQTSGDDNVPADDKWISKNPALFPNKNLRQRMAMLGQPVDNPNLCKSYEALLAQNNNNENNAKADVQNCMKLNAAGEYFNGGLVQMKTTASFTFISTRNNNFTNRDQKGVINVRNLLPNWAIALTAIGGAAFVGAGAIGGLLFYSRSHPHSQVAQLFSKM